MSELGEMSREQLEAYAKKETDEHNKLMGEYDRLRGQHGDRRSRVSNAVALLRETFKLRVGCNNIEDAVRDACAAHKAEPGDVYMVEIDLHDAIERLELLTHRASEKPNCVACAKVLCEACLAGGGE